MPTLAVDFDGVIHDQHYVGSDYQMGKPIEGAKEMLAYLRAEKKCRIVVFSVKPPDVVEDWLKYFEVPYDQVTQQKPNADAYLDDRGIRFTSWPEALTSLIYYGVIDARD